MKKINLVLIIIFISLLIPGCKKEETAQQKADRIELEKKKLQEKIDNKTILQINKNRFFNKDLKKYIRIHYFDLEEQSDNLRMLSRIFDSFVERKITLSITELQDIPVLQQEYERYLAKLNVPGEKIDPESIIDSIKLQKYLDAVVYKDIVVSKEEIREYYTKNHDEFTKKKEVLLYQIFVKDREKAINIRSILDKNPQDFEELAKTHSESHEAKNGGLMGYFEEGILPKEMEDVVFSLKINRISPVTESPYGFHIFKVTKQKRSGRLLYIKNVEDEIKDKLLSRKLRKAYQDFLTRLKSEMQINIKYKELYFKYQALKGDNKDEITQKIPAHNPNINSSQ